MTEGDIVHVRQRLEGVGHASIPYPSTISGYARRSFWRIYAPLHGYVRDLALLLHIVDHGQFADDRGRQPYLIGTIARDSSAETIVTRLIEAGYGNNSIAWHDGGEVASMRLPLDTDYQYHVRIFSDGEVRGHYEMTPESHPFKHYREVGMEERREYFRDLLAGMVV